MNKKTYIIVGGISIVVIALLIVLYFNYKRVEENDPTINVLDIVKSRISDVDWSSYETKDIVLEKTLNITTEGIFHLTGSISDGTIRINTKGKVKLVLDNISITNSKGPAIYVEDAKRLEIELKEGTTNTLNDSKVFTGTDADACIFSNEDLVISGDGNLEVNANHGIGIHSKKDLKISSGSIYITSIDDGVVGKDSIEVAGGNITIDSNKNGLKSTNIMDYDRGFIFIRDGNIKLNTRLDGIQSSSALFIKNGNIDIKTTGDPKEEENGKLISAKGLKGKVVVIENGNFNIVSTDDAMHSDDYVLISNMNGVIESGDDAIHADKTITIDDGTIVINNCYEGIEANDITINGGNINIKASDDGINASSSKDDSDEEFYDVPKRGKEKGNATLNINGGNICVDALGDGIDANGKITINDGNVVVLGPQDAANTAIDYDDEFIMNGGELIAIGYSGMAQGVSDSSKQVGILINTKEYYDSKFIIKDSKGKSILSYTPTKNYNSILISSPKLEMDSKISLYIDNKTIETIDIDNVSMVVGESNMSFDNPGHRPDRKERR